MVLGKHRLGVGAGPKQRLWERLGLWSNPQSQTMVMDAIRRVHDNEYNAFTARGGLPIRLFSSSISREIIRDGFIAEIPNLPASIQGLSHQEIADALLDLCQYYRHHDPTNWGLAPPSDSNWQPPGTAMAPAVASAATVARTVADTAGKTAKKKASPKLTPEPTPPPESELITEPTPESAPESESLPARKSARASVSRRKRGLDTTYGDDYYDGDEIPPRKRLVLGEMPEYPTLPDPRRLRVQEQEAILGLRSMEQDVGMEDVSDEEEIPIDPELLREEEL